MISIQMLEEDDIILPDDLVRQLSPSFEGQSDSFLESACYSGLPINRMGWIYAKYMCPYWVGKKVKDYHSLHRGEGKTGYYQPQPKYEFIRGNIPKDHLEKLTDKEIYLYEDFLKSFLKK